jgi:uncharacterized membrane protein YgcG
MGHLPAASQLNPYWRLALFPSPAAFAACVQDLTTGQKVFLDPSFNLSTYQPGAPPPGLAGCSTAAPAGTSTYNAAAPTAASPANPQMQSQVWGSCWLSVRPRGTQSTILVGLRHAVRHHAAPRHLSVFLPACCRSPCQRTAMDRSPAGRPPQAQAMEVQVATAAAAMATAWQWPAAGTDCQRQARPPQQRKAAEAPSTAMAAADRAARCVRTSQWVLLSLRDGWCEPWRPAAAACAQKLICPHGPLCLQTDAGKADEQPPLKKNRHKHHHHHHYHGHTQDGSGGDGSSGDEGRTNGGSGGGSNDGSGAPASQRAALCRSGLFEQTLAGGLVC